LDTESWIRWQAETPDGLSGSFFLEFFSAFSGLHIIIEEFHHDVKINSEEFHQYGIIYFEEFICKRKLPVRYKQGS
jgi:hypothetical protein